MINDSYEKDCWQPKYLAGEDLLDSLTVLPPYDPAIRNADISVRMAALSSLYEVYVPTTMSVEIYNKLFFAVKNSLAKKNLRTTVKQGYLNRMGVHGGVIGGSDSFSIVGTSGIGKSVAIERAVSPMGGEQVYTMTNPYRLFLPAVVVQTPFDCSPKGMLLSILQTVDERLGTHYYSNALRARATQDMLIGSVSQVCLNHIGVLIVDEIQNVIENRNGRNLVGLLTQMINASGVGICFVGTPEASAFFERSPYLARRTIGLHYGPMEYDDEFCQVCGTLLDYCCTARGISSRDALLGAAHEYGGGTISTVVALLHDAQEIAILSGREILDLQSLDMAWRTRMGTMHGALQLQEKKRAVGTARVSNNKVRPLRSQSPEKVAQAHCGKDPTKGGAYVLLPCHSEETNTVPLQDILCRYDETEDVDFADALAAGGLLERQVSLSRAQSLAEPRKVHL